MGFRSKVLGGRWQQVGVKITINFLHLSPITPHPLPIAHYPHLYNIYNLSFARVGGFHMQGT